MVSDEGVRRKGEDALPADKELAKTNLQPTSKVHNHILSVLVSRCNKGEFI